MKKIISFLLIGLLAFITACSSNSDAGSDGESKGKVSFSVHAGDAVKTTFFKMTKILEEMGYDVEIVETSGGNKASQFVLADTVDVGTNDTDELLLAISQGADLQAFMTEAGKVDYVLMAQPEFKSMEDLVGKTIGMSGPSGFDALMGRIAMMDIGYKSDDANWVVVGGSPERTKALEVGRIDAGVIFLSHYLELKAKGSDLNKIMYMSELVPDIMKGVYYAKQDWIEENPELVKDIVKAQLEANKWFHENREEWIALAMEWAKGSSEEAIEDLYDELKAVDMFPLDGGFSREGAEKMVELMVESGDLEEPIPVDEFLNSKYFEEVTK